MAQADSGTWTLNNNGNWSSSGNWSGGIIADGAGYTADFSQLDITANRTVTIDGAVASRTLGTLLFGDPGALTSSGYGIGANNGGTLTLNNNGSGALINLLASAGATIISAPIILADNLSLDNDSGNTLTLSGAVSGPGTITNIGSGAGATVISGVIGADVAGVVQNSASSQLTLSGANLFSSGVTINEGTVLVNSTAALGTGTVNLGAISGNANATLLVGSFTPTNTIHARAGSTGTLTIGVNGGAAARPAGNIILDNHVTLSVEAGGAWGRNTGAYLATSGTILGTGNLTLDVDGIAFTTNNGGNPQGDSLVVLGPVTTTGAIYNTGTGTGRSAITGNIDSASSVNQNSATSMMSLGGTNTYSGPTNVNAGVLRMSNVAAFSPNSAITVASGATLQMGQNSSTAVHAGQTLYLSGFGTSYSYGALDATNNANYAGSIVLQGDSAISADQSTGTTLTLSGPITGAGHDLTFSGIGNIAVTSGIATSAGGLIKQGTGLLTLSAANSFSGVTVIENGTVLLNHADALGGGGYVTFEGGSIRHSAANTQDLGSRIRNSTGSISIDTNTRTFVYSNIDSSNTGGLTKFGSGRLNLEGTNSFSGPIVVAGGVLGVTTASAIPSVGTGSIFIDQSGVLASGGAYSNIQAWLDSDNIAANSTGAIGLTGNSTESIDFTGYEFLGLGVTGNVTYSGIITPANSTYRLGGGPGTLTIAGTNTLTGNRGLVVSSGSVSISGANDLSGATTVASNVLTLTGSAGALANSDITVSPGATLAFAANNSATALTRAASVTLNRGTLTVAGNNTVNITETITNGLTIGTGGNSIVTITPNAARNVLLTSGSLSRNAGGTALIRGASLGVNTIASQTANSANISLTAANLVGGSGVNITDGGIFVGMIGDTVANGIGFSTTSGLLTYDSNYGVRLLRAGEYKTSITNAQTQLDNVLLNSTGGTVLTTTLNDNTTINSLSIGATGAGSGILVAGTGTLTLNSGVIYGNTATTSTSSGVSNSIDFAGREGVIFFGGSGTSTLALSGVLANTGGNGITLYGNTSNKTVVFSGAEANTYTGTTTINGGRLQLAKTAGVNAITGDLVINSGASVIYGAANQIADTAHVFVNGGALDIGAAETIANLSLSNNGTTSTDNVTVTSNLSIGSGATLTTGVAKLLNVGGALSLSDGGSLRIQRSQSITGIYDSIVSVGALNITNSTSGTSNYNAITIDHGAGLPQSAGKLVLNGDLTFTGNATNTNTAVIDAIKGAGRQGVVELNGARAFNIGNGAARVDLRITGGLTDGSTAGGLIKNDDGTLDLTGDNTFTGSTVVNAGTLLINGTSLSAVSVNGGTFGGAGVVSNSVTIGNNGRLAAGAGDLAVNTGVLGTGNLSLAGADATIVMEIAGTGAGQYDQISVTGAVALDGNGKIEVNLLSFVPNPTDIFFLILNDGSDAISGTLFGLAQGATFNSGGYTWQVSYQANSTTNSFSGGNDLAIQAIPEPSTWALIGVGLMIVMVLRRRRLS